jgi:hypothetical protein
MAGMERVHPKVPAQREVAEWWLAEVRRDLELATTEREARAWVVFHAGRISPTVLASVSAALGVAALSDFDDRHAIGLLARITNTLVRPFRDNVTS